MAVMDSAGMGSVELVDYQHEIEQWRKEREDALRAPDGWLSLAGLHMLEAGDYTLGSDAGKQIVLPPSVPATLGTLSFDGDRALLQVVADAPVLVGGVPVSTVELVDNRNGRVPTLVRVGSVSMNLHRFGEEIALRVRDSTSVGIQNFTGCKWYPIDPAYRIVGQLTRTASPTVIQVATSVKSVAEYQSIGTITFALQGQSLTLLGAATSKASEIMIIFRDGTTGRTTYGAGRYLYAQVEDDQVVLDFNKAYSPPCAFTPYATCSLPPAQNHLPVPIEAGELYSG